MTSRKILKNMNESVESNEKFLLIESFLNTTLVYNTIHTVKNVIKSRSKYLTVEEFPQVHQLLSV